MAKTGVVVSQDLIYSYLKEPRLKALFNFLEHDVEVQTYLRMGNIMAVRRPLP